MGRRQTTFSKKFRVYPLSSLERPESVVRGGKVLLPAACFKELHAARKGFKATHTCLSVKSTATKKETVLGVLECSGDDVSQVFVPDWAMQQLRLAPGDEVRVRLVTLPTATWLQVRLGPEAHGVQDVEEALEAHLQGFAALSVGDEMTVRHGEREFWLQVLQTKPKKRVRLPADLGHELSVQVDLEEVPEAAPEVEPEAAPEVEPEAAPEVEPEALQPAKRKAGDAPEEEEPVPEKKIKKDDEPRPSLTPEQLQEVRDARISKFQR